jgi:NADPH:quinone reductase-like Zn-dependent oxidoreductase
MEVLMKAMQVNSTKQGPALICADVPQPEPGADEVLVQVHAAGVTPTELTWYTTSHNKEGSARTGAVPTHEFSGTIAALGKNVRGLSVGDAVYGLNDWFASGAAAEYCVTLPQNIVAKPTVLTHEAAATVPIAALTVWQGLLDRAKIQAGERILIHGGAGAVGLFAVQLAHRQGAYVITTVSARDAGFVKQLGAHEVIDYRAARFEAEVRDADVIFDTVGGETLSRSWSVLKAGGRMVTIAAGSESSSDQRVKDAFFIVEPNQSQLAQITKLIDAGHLKTFVKAVVPLSEAATAFDGSIKGSSGRGTIVISVSA